ncbi:hypothetical protein TPY_1111 [Sulfobacillus acidophilus TPY]|uniref:DUF1641 domain-containing protein n=1 Tax=Sulfobacillus acidophilus (strain ATCC 700253 / DSM 10332 / NAL) TaxID=679936 RepID=G8TWL3_SULAD|nr:hypothetical protein TPY_1111 [Sulfobacillus acidophilus TPY]AEW06002.1 protein of unknown function DUF1641 [Sulfobacillus acidophilus DSM 10332]
MATIEVSDATLSEWMTLLNAVKDSATPALAERIAGMITALGQLAGPLAEPETQTLIRTAVETGPALTEMLETLATWHRTGTWDALKELATVATAVKDSATPHLAERVAGMATALGQLTAPLTDPAAQDLVRTAVDSGPELTEMIATLRTWHQTGTWDALKELATVATALKDSASPHLVERMTTLGVQLGRVVKDIGPGVEATVSAAEDEGAALAQLLRQVGEWTRDGTWQTVTELMALLRGFRESATPQLTERLIDFITHSVLALREAIDSGLLELGLALMQSLHEATEEADKATTRITITGLMRSLKDPGIQYALHVLLGIGRRFPQTIKDATQ